MANYSGRGCGAWRVGLLLLALGATTAAAANEANEADELQQLMVLLDEQTEIATKTRLNADFVPGLVTVLRGDELINRGVRTVWEALALVPGIELSIEETGRRQVVVRGVGRTYASGNVKLLLNNVSLNAAQNGLADPLFNMPLQQVERIEVIRGPGSAVHGEYAFSGVVNVITRSANSSLFTSLANDGGYGVGGNFSREAADGRWRMNLNLAASGGEGAAVRAGPDLLYPDDAALSYAPGPTNEKAEYRAALFDLNYADLALSLQWLENGMGEHFGINSELPPPQERIVTRYRFATVQAQQAFRPATGVSGHITLGWQENRETKDELFVDPGVYWSGDFADPDIVLDSSYGEERLYGGVDLTWKAGARHTLFAELALAQVEVDEGWMRLNLDPQSWLPSATMFEYDYLISEGKTRRISSLTLQDEFRANGQFTLTSGLRYDSYSDVGDSLNPRLAAVWQLNRNHILKGQYAHAFRPSSFYELGGSVTGLAPATIDSTELAYIYRQADTVARAVLFGSDIDNLVVFVDDGGYLGFDSIKAQLRGVELELEQQLSRRFKLAGDLSYVDTYDLSSGKQLAFSSNWLANVGLSFQPRPKLMGTLQWRYVGARNRQAGDTRPALQPYSSMDASVGRLALLPGLDLRAGVKNMFAQAVRYPAPMNTYDDDYPRAGRQWWMELNYSF
jgi:outer membrane receptor for ferrienterochelin and colicins